MRTCMAKPIKLTKEGLERALNKLERLERKFGELLVKKKEALYQGEGWHDNAEFDMFKQDQMALEEQIEDLKEVLRSAEVVETGNVNERVGIGSTVVISMAGEEKEYTLVDPMEARPSEGKISYACPLGVVLMGAKPNEKRVYRLGQREKEITILSVKQRFQAG